MDNALIPYLELLKACGFKLTSKRLDIITVFLKEQRTLAPQEVHRRLARSRRAPGLPTVYRILEELTSAGVLVSVVSGERLLSYALCSRPREHHHHFICRSCSRMEEVDYCAIDEARHSIQKKLGCRIEKHLFQIEGLCMDCLKKEKIKLDKKLLEEFIQMNQKRKEMSLFQN